MASLYTKSANREALSKGAVAKMARDETKTSIPAPLDVVPRTSKKV